MPHAARDLQRAAGADDRGRAARRRPSAARDRSSATASSRAQRAKVKRDDLGGAAPAVHGAAKTLVGADIEIVMPLGGLIDVAAETARIAKDIEKADKEIAVIEKKLGERRLPRARARGGRRRAAARASPTSSSARSALVEALATLGGGVVIAPLSRTRAALLVVDIQERLAPAMPEATRGAGDPQHADPDRGGAPARRCRSSSASSIRKGSARPSPRSRTRSPAPTLHRFDKLEFSAAASPAFAALAPQLKRDQWIVCGMETHVCVYQTARDLVARG